MTTPVDPEFQDPLAAIAIYLEGARGLEVVFEHLEPYQHDLLKTMGVTAIMRPRIPEDP